MAFLVKAPGFPRGLVNYALGPLAIDHIHAEHVVDEVLSRGINVAPAGVPAQQIVRYPHNDARRFFGGPGSAEPLPQSGKGGQAPLGTVALGNILTMESTPITLPSCPRRGVLVQSQRMRSAIFGLVLVDA